MRGLSTAAAALLLVLPASATFWTRGGRRKDDDGDWERCQRAGYTCSHDDDCCTGMQCSWGYCQDKCSMADESCASHDDCCSSLECQGGTCKEQCYERNERCSYRWQCCDGLVFDGSRCIDPPPTCAAQFDHCDGATSCCDDLVCDFASNVCDEPCMDQNAWCDDNSTCCDGLICDENFCQEPCKYQDEYCDTDSDCCDGLECGGDNYCHETSSPPPGCVSEYGVCSGDSECCRDLACDSGACSRKECQQSTGRCTMDEDCCGNLYCKSFAMGMRTPECRTPRQPGDPCDNDTDCESNLACRTPQDGDETICEVLTSPGCLPVEVECRTDDECCEGLICKESPLGGESPSQCTESEVEAEGDPHLVGFRGQKFDFTGQDGGYYALLTEDEPSTVVTMLLHAPVPTLQVVTYIVGFALQAADADGVMHTVQVRVKHPEDFYTPTYCPTNTPCLADGAIEVLLDEKPMISPAQVEIGSGFSVGAVNIPGECRPFGFENYWAEKVRQAEASAPGAAGGRRLDDFIRYSVPMDEWILGDSKATNMQECKSFVAKHVAQNSLFHYQSEHTSFQIVTPNLTIRLNHGKLHQLAMRDPTDQFDLPDHRTFQMNMGIERAFLGMYPQGVLGETLHPTVDVSTGKPIMRGMSAVRGTEEDYRVSGPFSSDFSIRHDDGDLKIAFASSALE